MNCSQLAGRVVLVVEDEPLVGLDLAEALTSLGARVVSAHAVAGAIMAVDRVELSAAVLDINLRGQDCAPICQHLRARGIPFLFSTGYDAAPDGWAGVPIVSKPALRQQIIDGVAALCAGALTIGTEMRSGG